jgi:hypothetical protein
VLQELLSAAADAGFLLLVEGLPAESVHAVCEASFHEGVVHSQTIADLELVDHGRHAHLVLLRETVEVAEHALVHRRRRRRERRRKARVLEEERRGSEI